MRIIHDPEELKPFTRSVFVPTMGALHAGHEALIEHAAARAARMAVEADAPVPVVVSVFVNPTQFNEAADFDAYPRTLEADAALAARAGADVVFAPSPAAIYPPDGSPAAAAAFLPNEADLPEVARLPQLEDRHRPGHFAGVYGVVKRLFVLTECAAAVFGEKDWQQLQLIRAMVQQERLSVDILAHHIVREEDGVALSSRNARLSPVERKIAGYIPAAIVAAQGQSTPEAAEQSARSVFGRSSLAVEYVAVRDAATLMAYKPGQPARLLIAARLGNTRLIDNAPWQPRSL